MNKLIAISAALLLLSACSDDDDNDRPDTGTDPTTGQNFRSTTGKGVDEEPSNTFRIPTCGDDRKLGYITMRWRTPLPAGATFTMAFNVWLSEGASVVGYEEMNVAGRAALHFQRKSPDSDDPYALSEKLYNRGYRQWSHTREMLTSGDHVFSAVLKNELWTGGGSQADSAFNNALNDPGYAGITLSGSQTAGHGVCMTAGTGYVTIYNLSVQ